MSITVYSFENAAGPFGSFTTMDLEEAKEYGRNNALKVIANEYEFADSEPVEDFTSDRKARLLAALGEHGLSIDNVPWSSDFALESLDETADAVVLVEKYPTDSELWITVHESPEDAAAYRNADDSGYEVAFVVNVDTGEQFDIETHTTITRRS